jgi:hypothetical protein
MYIILLEKIKKPTQNSLPPVFSICVVARASGTSTVYLIIHQYTTLDLQIHLVILFTKREPSLLFIDATRVAKP